MTALLPFILAIMAAISTACCQEVAYAYSESGGRLLESANITEYNGTDTVTSAITGAGLSFQGSGMTVDEMKEEINLKLNVPNQVVDNKASSLVLDYPGDRTINQICSIYEHMVGKWSYKSDTRGIEVFQYSNQSLERGAGRFSGQGDCDDFAILLASLVESVGGTSRIILAYGPMGGHAYTEVYLGNASSSESDVQRMLSWLRKNYKVKDVNTHTDLKTDDVWLNLDWWKDPNTGRDLAKHPGGPFFSATSQIPIPTRDGIKPQPLNPPNEPPQALFEVFPEVSNAGQSTIFNASKSRDIGGRIDSYLWDFGDGNRTGVREPIVGHVYLKGGLYSINLTVEDDEGVFNFSSRNIMINNPPQASFSFYPPAPRPNETVFFDASQSNDIEDGSTLIYKWDFGDGDTGIGARKLHPYLLGGIYKVNLTVIDSNDAENSASREIKVNRPPHAMIRYDKEEPNAGDLVSFDSSDSFDDDSSIIGYFWDFGDGNTSEEKSPAHVYQEGGNFTVNLTVKDSDNATDANITRIKINERPIAAFIFSPVNPDVNEGITFDASESNDPDGIVEYIWDFGEGKKPESWIGPLAYYTYHRKGNYEVGLTVVDSKKAKNFKKERIDVDESHAPIEVAQPGEEEAMPFTPPVEEAITSTPTPTEIEIRSRIATGTYSWTADDFAGFYYDIDDNIKTEELTATVTDNKLLEPDGVVYRTTAMEDSFDYGAWGDFLVIGFLGEKYFAGYVDNYERIDDVLFEKSEDENVLADKQLLKILVDNDDEMTVTSGTPLRLEEGYELSIKSIDIDANMVYLELSKDGSVVDSKVISPSRDGASMLDKTYYYKKDVGDSKDVVIIAAHFKNAFRGADQDLATVDGLWQLSDTATDVSEKTEYDKMTIQTLTSYSIMMNNEDNDITLSKGKDISLMPGVSIKTADADEFRYYIYKEITEPGTYEIRGSVATESYTWTADDFAGFYYDIDDNIKTEELTATVTDNKLLEPDGVVYTTTAMEDNFDYDAWGEYFVIGFLAEKYFAGYIDNPDIIDDVLFEESEDKNILAQKQLLKILKDNDNEIIVTSGTPLKLEEGYELGIKSIDIDGNKVYLELSKDGSVVDSKVISPSRDGATMLDKTYYYKKDVGDSKDVVIIAAHFKNAFRGAEQDLATVDGLWQLSDTATDVSEKTEYDKMTIQTLTSDSIMMNNEDNDITLSNGKDASLMWGVRIKTASPSAEEGNYWLRYYIYKTVTIAEPSQ